MNSPKSLLFIVVLILAGSVSGLCKTPNLTRTINVGTYQYKPLVFIDKEGQPTGLFVDLIKDIAAKNDWQVVFTEGTWQENLNRLSEGKIDLVLGMVMNGFRSSQYDMNDKAVVSSWIQLYSTNKNSVTSILDLDQKVIYALRGDSYFTAFKEVIAKFNIHPHYIEKDKIDEVFQSAKTNPNSFAACEWIAGLAYYSDYQLTETPIMLVPNAMGFATTKGMNNDLLYAIDQYMTDGINHPNSSYHRIISKWLHSDKEWQMPVWIRLSLIIGISLLLFSMVLIFFSRFQVRRKTRELSFQNKQLLTKEEILKKWAHIFEHTQWGIYVLSCDNQSIELMNPTFQTMHGYEVGEFSKMPLVSLFSMTDESVRLERYQKAHRNGHEIFEALHVRKDGSTFPVQVDISTVKNELGELVYCIVNVQDITVRKKAEEDLKQTISLLDATLQATNDGILVIDNERKITSYSNHFLNMWRIPEESIDQNDDHALLGKVHDLLEDPEEFTRKVEEIYRDRTLMTYDEFKLKDGRVFERFSKPQVIENKTVGRVWSFRDVTERVRMLNVILERERELSRSNESLKSLNEEYLTLNEEYLTINEELLTNQHELQTINAELLRAKERAEEADHLKSAFLSNMSHEIRTPMNAIIGFSSILDTPDMTNAERHEFIKIIQQRGKDLLHIIDDVLDVSRIESGQLRIVESETDIEELFNEIHQIYDRPDQYEKKNGLQLMYQNLLPIEQSTLILDASRIKQILLNMIGNAYKFTEKGSIEYGCFRQMNQVHFYVKDTGIGIPAEKLTIIFERFRQVNESYLVNTKGGAGLGLSICKGLIDLMGGKIWVESSEGEGSTFHFSIPFKPVEKQLS